MKITKRRTVVAGIAVAGLTAALVPLVTADAATTAPAGITIRIASSGKCLNVAGASKANNAKIIQYTCSGTAANDKFTLVPTGQGRYQIRNTNSGKCLNVQGDSTANSAKVIQYTCSTAYNSVWTVRTASGRPTVQFVSVRSGRCLNLPNNSTANGTQLIQYSCNADGRNDKFFMPPTASADPVARPADTVKGALAVRQDSPSGESPAPVAFSWITDTELVTVVHWDPDYSHDGEPDPVIDVDLGDTLDGFVGRPFAVAKPDGHTRFIAQDAVAGDAVLADHQRGSKDFTFDDIGGALPANPTIGPVAPNRYAAYAIVGGALWYAPQYGTSAQPPIGGWRSLGGGGLTGTPAVVAYGSGARVFARSTTGALKTATLSGATLSTWVDLGGNVTGVPAAITRPGNASTVAALSSGKVVTRRINGDGTSPGGWAEAGTGLTAVGSPSITWDESAGRVVVAARTGAGRVHTAYETAAGSGAFGAWVGVDGPVAGSDPTVFSYQDTSSGGVRGYGIAYQDTSSSLTWPQFALVDTRAAKTGSALTTRAPKMHRLPRT